eukprot:6157812-Pleurochrysis_carterae.AAC.7
MSRSASHSEYGLLNSPYESEAQSACQDKAIPSVNTNTEAAARKLQSRCDDYAAFAGLRRKRPSGERPQSIVITIWMTRSYTRRRTLQPRITQLHQQPSPAAQTRRRPSENTVSQLNWPTY